MPPTLSPVPAAALASRAEALLERLRACSLDALDTLGAPEPLDAPALDRFVRERARIITALSPLTADVAALPAGDPLRASLAMTMTAVIAADSRLTQTIEHRQQEVAAALLRAQRESRPTAYQAAPTTGLALDLVR